MAFLVDAAGQQRRTREKLNAAALADIGGDASYNPFNKELRFLSADEREHIKTTNKMRKELLQRPNPYFAFMNVFSTQPQRFGTPRPPSPTGTQI